MTWSQAAVWCVAIVCITVYGIFKLKWGVGEDEEE